jgi:hypothetical protein
LIDEHPLVDGRTAADVAEMVHLAFRDQCPDEYQQMAEQLVRRAIHVKVVAREQSYQHIRRREARRAALARDRNEAVATGSLKVIDKLYVVNDGHQRKRLGVLTHQERLYALDRFDTQIRSRQLEQAFLAEIDRRCGDRTVEEVLDPETVNTLFVSIIGEAAA